MNNMYESQILSRLTTKIDERNGMTFDQGNFESFYIYESVLF